jgi:hypothetical protein
MVVKTVVAMVEIMVVVVVVAAIQYRAGVLGTGDGKTPDRLRYLTNHL